MFRAIFEMLDKFDCSLPHRTNCAQWMFTQPCVIVSQLILHPNILVYRQHSPRHDRWPHHTGMKSLLAPSTGYPGIPHLLPEPHRRDERKVKNEYKPSLLFCQRCRGGFGHYNNKVAEGKPLVPLRPISWARSRTAIC